MVWEKIAFCGKLRKCCGKNTFITFHRDSSTGTVHMQYTRRMHDISSSAGRLGRDIVVSAESYAQKKEVWFQNQDYSSTD